MTTSSRNFYSMNEFTSVEQIDIKFVMFYSLIFQECGLSKLLLFYLLYIKEQNFEDAKKALLQNFDSGFEILKQGAKTSEIIKTVMKGVLMVTYGKIVCLLCKIKKKINFLRYN